MGRLKSQFNQIETEIKLITGNRQDYDNAIAAKNK
jgi:flagellar biosynthesis chaperone FliJ